MKILRVHPERGESTALIGRNTDGLHVDLADDEYVSTRHALLHCDDQGVVTVEDVGSTNGTYVNGVSLSMHNYCRRVFDGDVVRVGHTDIRIVVGTAVNDKEQSQ